MMPRPRKHLGQHFLHDPAVIDRIITTIAPRRSDCMVEIGPGGGALTGPLLERVDELHAIELDRTLAGSLAETLGHAGLRTHHGDALRFDFAQLARGPQSLRIVGNLPYNISTPLLFHLLRYAGLIRDLHVMLQREVVARMVAPPGGKDYGRLTVMLALAADVDRCFDIGPGAFRPPPQVWSSFVRLTPHPSPPIPIADAALLSELVARAFSMRRKRISNSLKRWLTGAQIAALGIDPGLRPERLSPREFVTLANAVVRPDDRVAPP